MNKLKHAILEKAQLLAADKASPVVISTWAINLELEYQDEIIKLRQVDQALDELFQSMQLAGQMGSENKLLYGINDFQQWLNEYTNIQQNGAGGF